MAIITDSQIFWDGLLIIRTLFPSNVFPEFIFCWSKTAFTFPKIHKDEGLLVHRKTWKLDADRSPDLGHLATSLVCAALFLLEYAELNALHMFMLRINLFKNIMWNIKQDGYATNGKYTNICLSMIKGWILIYLPSLIYNFPYYISLRDVHTTWHIHFEEKIVVNHYITICLSVYLFNKYLLSKYHVKRDRIQHTKISESLYFASNLGTTYNTFFVATWLFLFVLKISNVRSKFLSKLQDSFWWVFKHFVLNSYYQLDISAVLRDTHETAERDNIKID